MTAEERRTSILDAAVHVFGESGYATTSTRQVAGEAGISEATIFKYFGTKPELFAQAVHHAAERLAGALAAAREQGGADPDKWLEAAVGAVTQQRRATRVLFDAAVQATNRDVQLAAHDAIQGIIAEFEVNIARLGHSSQASVAAWWAFSQYLLIFFLEALDARDLAPAASLTRMRSLLIDWLESE